MHTAINKLSRTSAHDNDKPFVSCVDSSIQGSPFLRHRRPDKCCAGFCFRHPPPRSSDPIQFWGFVFEVLPPSQIPRPLEAKTRINDARVFCFRAPPLRNEGPEQHKRVLSIPGSHSSAKQWPGQTHTHIYHIQRETSITCLWRDILKHCASPSPAIAQLLEHPTVELCSNQMVPGSIPGGRIFGTLSGIVLQSVAPYQTSSKYLVTFAIPDAIATAQLVGGGACIVNPPPHACDPGLMRGKLTLRGIGVH